jgi:ribosomal protein L37E
MGWSDVIFGYELPVLTPKVSIALTLASIAVIGTALLFIHARRVYPSRRCPKCGYDRTHAESEVCTECGIRPSSGAFRLPPWSTIAWISLLCIATLSWPAYKAFRWSEVRGWTPPLPAYRVEVVRTFSTGHTLQRLHCRNPFSPDYPFVLRVIDAGGTERVAYPCDGCGGSIGLWTMDEAPELIDGDEFADVIFVNSSSGTQCFATYTCYRLAPDGSVVPSWTREDGCNAVFQDVDGDGNVEIVTIDDYRYVFACGACLNPHVRTVYQFFGDGWILDTDAMRKPAPSQDAFDEVKRTLLAFDWSEEIAEDGPYDPFYTKAVGELWAVMLDLIYEGNGQTAVDLLDAVWPEHLDNRTAVLAYFIEKVRIYTGRSGTWEAIEGMQDPPVDWPAFLKE